MSAEVETGGSNRGSQVHVKTVSHVCHKMAVFGKKFKKGVSQNTGYFIWLICFDPSNFKVTSCSKAVTRQRNGLLAYDCHQLTLFPRKISFYPKNFKMLLFGARVTEDVGNLYLFSISCSCFLLQRDYNRIELNWIELRIELLLFKKTPCWTDCHNRIWIYGAAVCFWWKTFLEARPCGLTWAVDREKDSIMWAVFLWKGMFPLSVMNLLLETTLFCTLCQNWLRLEPHQTY